MSKRPEIDRAIRDRIEALRAEARIAYQAGDKASFTANLEQAWSLIPGEKAVWDYYPQTLARSLVRIYIELEDVPAAKRWLATAYKVYGDPQRENLFVLMLEGDALFRLDLTDEAYAVFSKVFQLYGRDGFKGEQLKYLEFFLKERANRNE